MQRSASAFLFHAPISNSNDFMLQHRPTFRSDKALQEHAAHNIAPGERKTGSLVTMGTRLPGILAADFVRLGARHKIGCVSRKERRLLQWARLELVPREVTGEREERGWKYKRLVAAEVADGGGSCRCIALADSLQVARAVRGVRPSKNGNQARA